MDDARQILGMALEWHRQGRRMAIATVLTTWGSAPRPVSSHMVIADDGGMLGSVSGGCVEYDVIATAEAVLRGAPATTRSYGVTTDQAFEAGLPCGGEIEVLIQAVSPAGYAPDLMADVVAALDQGRPVTLHVEPDNLVTGTDPHGGDWTIRYMPPCRLLIVGAVQIAQFLAQIAGTTGIAVTINDPRDRFLTRERFPFGTLTDAWPDEAVAAFAPDASSAVVTLSHDIKIDDPALIAALGYPTAYIAALGSRRNHSNRCARLEAGGLSPDQIARIDGPAGVPIHAIGPAEIAVSILAGMIARLRAPS